MEQLPSTDCTIIGGGPAGLYAAFYAGMRDLSVRIIENQSKLGGKLHFYPEKMIWDIGGMKPTPGLEVMEQMIHQAQTFSPKVELNQLITKISKLGPQHFRVFSSTGDYFDSKSIIIATGGGIFTPKRLPGIYCEPYETANLHYTIYRMKDFENKRVAIVGGGNSAIDWANELKDRVKELHVIHRRDEFTAHESQIRQLSGEHIHIHTYSAIEELLPDDSQDKIRSIRLHNTKTGTRLSLPIDELLVNIGFETEQNVHQDEALNLELIDHYYIKGSSLAETSIQGMYAIGDILDFQGKVRLIAGAYNDAVNAVNQIRQYCYPLINHAVVMSSMHDGLQNRV
ncbi:NAD(P)/FAD-dependent oxidoreductase [Alkalibacterium sp. MB6]|uniref:NAD(P)/FAD-dependent oxidoreductase n=1 Tax=Alkalibacterium sp. MB6 TaxID=2081965 RepID=UPI00137ABB04|nr:NAD(P)/FAD-dependent oxidoreductase [Alkalibacterium sp. MB6]